MKFLFSCNTAIILILHMIQFLHIKFDSRNLSFYVSNIFTLITFSISRGLPTSLSTGVLSCRQGLYIISVKTQLYTYLASEGTHGTAFIGCQVSKVCIQVEEKPAILVRKAFIRCRVWWVTQSSMRSANRKASYTPTLAMLGTAFMVVKSVCTQFQ